MKTECRRELLLFRHDLSGSRRSSDHVQKRILVSQMLLFKAARSPVSEVLCCFWLVELLEENITTKVQICRFPAAVGLFLGATSLFILLASVKPSGKHHVIGEMPSGRFDVI